MNFIPTFGTTNQLYCIMKRFSMLFISMAMLSLCLPGVFSQTIIFSESFGTNGYYDGAANGYGEMDNPSSMYTVNTIIVQAWNPSANYDDASGKSRIFVDNGKPVFTIQNLNTSDYNNCRLAFGTACWFGLPSAYMKVEYSTNGTVWTNIDPTNVVEGSYTSSPGGSAPWGFVRLGTVLPTSASLSIRFTSIDAGQGFFLDDVKIIGYSNDATPPAKVTGLAAENIVAGGFRLRWNASTDNQGIDHYEVKQDGSTVASTSSLSASISYLNAGSYNFTVVAYDVAGNPSEVSDALLVVIPALPADYKYSWEDNQATVSTTGDLTWAPKEFVYSPGASVRYIDFEGGDNANDGLTKATAWKHHPWDPSATGNSLASTGIHTYVFKRGVIYRGYLNAKESGENGNPIKLTSDPSWGTGEACIYGSVRITGGWAQANASAAPGVPNPELVYYQTISNLGETKCVYEVDGDNFSRVRVARSPNYRDTGSDPMKDWWSFTSKQPSSGKLKLTDIRNLTATDAATYTGGTVWAIEDAVVMSALWKQGIDFYTPSDKSISVQDQNFGGVGFKYFIENTPYLLDTTSEYYYNRDNGRMFIRLESDKNPNTAILEIATRSKLMDINNRSNIEISGLTFGFTTFNNVRYGEGDAEPTIKLNGACKNITVKNCNFQNLNGGILANNSSDAANPASQIVVSDNDFENMDDFGVYLLESSGNFLEDASILRNRFYNIGARHLCRWYSSISTIRSHMEFGEVAGNIVEYSWGSGINITWGKNSGSGNTIPFVRGLVHHNKVSHSLMGVNDYGGIEGWQGGPAFYYNNISHDAQGYKYNWDASLGYAYYFDGAFKQYVFNNIASGTGWNKNGALYTQVLGFYNIWAHNNAYNARSFSSSGGETIAPDGQNSFLANAMDSLDLQFSHTTRESGIPFEAYKYNVFSGRDFSGNFVQGGGSKNFDSFVTSLLSYKADEYQTGYETSKRIFTNPSAHNYQPTPTSELIDRGVKFFAPYPLSKVVGEWHFYKHRADSSLIKADNFYFTSDYTSRETYNNVPKNTMKAYGLSDTSFRTGYLEDWTPGSLYFNGTTTYCTALHTAVSSRVCNNVDMTTDNFILEAMVKTAPGHTGGVIAAKFAASARGYRMAVDASGYLEMSLVNSGSSEFKRVSATAINDGNWHHILAEVNRKGTITIYIDGQSSNGSATGSMPASAQSITNSGDFLVGKDRAGSFFRGEIDFLRVSKGLLADARTTIDELYRWQFDGPFLRDFAGNEPIGKRDAGALEGGEKLCQLSISPDQFALEQTEGVERAIVSASEGYEITKQKGTFFNYSTDVDTINLSYIANPNFEPSLGEIWVYGCNETKIIPVVQDGAPCSFESEIPETIDFSQAGGQLKYRFYSNGAISITKTGNLTASLLRNATKDTLKITVTAALTTTFKTTTVTLTGCFGQRTFVINQNKVTALDDAIDSQIKLTPNPTRGNFTITIPASYTGSNVALVKDVTGKVLHRETVFAGTREIAFDAPAGLYFVEIVGTKSSGTVKLIVE